MYQGQASRNVLLGLIGKAGVSGAQELSRPYPLCHMGKDRALVVFKIVC